jgi:ankyrin repeat protein
MGFFKARVTITAFLILSVSTSLAAQEEISQETFLEDDLTTFITHFDSEQADLYLHQSIASGSNKILAHLLTLDVNPNINDKSGFSALHKAIIADNIEAFEQLINAGANVNQQRVGGLESTPLMYAVSKPSTEFSELLIAQNADVNILDLNEDPALNWAAYYGHVQQLELLINSGADLSINSIHGNAVDVTVRLWHADSVLQVFRETELMDDLSRQNELLLEAVIKEDVPQVLDLLAEGTDPNSGDGLNNPLLQIAAANGNIQIAANFILNGADVNRLNRAGQSPLAFAARFAHTDIVELLIEWDADVNLAGERYKLTPLIGAAIGGNTTIGRLLIEAGANINQKDVINGGSPLLWAIMYSNTEFAEMLINKGAEFYNEDEQVYSAYQFAQQMGNQHLVNLMEAKMK